MKPIVIMKSFVLLALLLTSFLILYPANAQAQAPIKVGIIDSIPDHPRPLRMMFGMPLRWLSTKSMRKGVLLEGK